MSSRTFQRDDIRRSPHLLIEHLRGVRLLAVSVLRHLQRRGSADRLRAPATSDRRRDHTERTNVTSI